MVIGGQHFASHTLDRIQQTLADEPCIYRLELSRRVCQWLDWRSPNGQRQDTTCRKALARLSDDWQQIGYTTGRRDGIANKISLRLFALPPLVRKVLWRGL